jgi:adenosylcobinamide kinase/adenosylcobinamide-phosphate guanylyltransferase
VRVLVLGGIRSGKSEFAESVIARSGDQVRYLATGVLAADDEWTARVSAHRERRPSNWTTVETSDVTKQLVSDDAGPTLVDDIGGWLTAAMDRTQAWTGGSARADVDGLVEAVSGYRADLVLVSPEVGLTVVPETMAGRLFADQLGDLNQRLAAVCDRVFLVVAGQPVTVKEPS